MLKRKISGEKILMIFNINGNKTVYDDANAKVLDKIFSLENSPIYVVKFKREVFQTENLKIVFIDIENKMDLGLR